MSELQLLLYSVRPRRLKVSKRRIRRLPWLGWAEARIHGYAFFPGSLRTIRRLVMMYRVEGGLVVRYGDKALFGSKVGDIHSTITKGPRERRQLTLRAGDDSIVIEGRVPKSRHLLLVETEDADYMVDLHNNLQREGFWADYVPELRIADDPFAPPA